MIVPIAGWRWCGLGIWGDSHGRRRHCWIGVLTVDVDRCAEVHAPCGLVQGYCGASPVHDSGRRNVQEQRLKERALMTWRRSPEECLSKVVAFGRAEADVGRGVGGTTEACSEENAGL